MTTSLDHPGLRYLHCLGLLGWTVCTETRKDGDYEAFLCWSRVCKSKTRRHFFYCSASRNNRIEPWLTAVVQHSRLSVKTEERKTLTRE